MAWLAESPAPAAVPVLLDVLPALPETWDREAAAAALWACAGPADADALRKAVAGGDPAVRAAAIPALEAVSPAGAADVVDLLKPFLEDKDDRVRLAAARALVDRRPKESAAALLALLASDDVAVRSQAAWLLQQLSGLPKEADADAGDFAATAKKWREWAASPAADHPAPVGRKRLELARFGAIVAETFAEAKADVTGGYHAFRYEAFVEAVGGGFGPGNGKPGAPAVGWAAAVKDGVLRLDGNHPEGDQRLYVTADRLLGLPAFPARFRIRAKLGGEADGAGVWHVGVSAGNVRILFHPAYPGGGFRAERIDNHKFLVQNQTMPFTPAGGALYDMTIDVRRLDGGAVRFDVAIDDGAGKRYEQSITADAADVGELRRIGLERSGRTGGAALFGPVTIGNVAPGPGKSGG